MLFRRNNQNDTLPSTSYGSGHGGGLPFAGSGGSLDGSGRSIKMDAPVVKAWKQASGYTRYSYYILAIALFMVFYGFRSMMHWNGTVNDFFFLSTICSAWTLAIICYSDFVGDIEL